MNGVQAFGAWLNRTGATEYISTQKWNGVAIVFKWAYPIANRLREALEGAADLELFSTLQAQKQANDKDDTDTEEVEVAHLTSFLVAMGRPFPKVAAGGVVVRLPTSHLGETGSIPGSGSLPDFRMWESYQKMPLVGGFSRGSRFSPCPLIPSLLHTRLVSQDFSVKSRLNLFTHSFPEPRIYSERGYQAPIRAEEVHAHIRARSFTARARSTRVVIFIAPLTTADARRTMKAQCLLTTTAKTIPYKLSCGVNTHTISLSLALPTFSLSSTLNQTNRVLFSVGSPPDFRMRKSWWTKPLVGGFSRRSHVFPALSFRRFSIHTSITLIGSQDIAVKSNPNLFTHSRYLNIFCNLQSLVRTERARKTFRIRFTCVSGDSMLRPLKVTANCELMNAEALLPLLNQKARIAFEADERGRGKKLFGRLAGFGLDGAIDTAYLA
ncbi:hypothetical protein PR048_006359 [Dryococelus australis]|uniref:Uncharacterized protein n=1 Tax=Dryococelus australis TaxID=614101 RepID=A0ABQ9IAR8_9NEOP|nr:hypothetical protein PR048_006359 [Dryococelus australis]